MTPRMENPSLVVPGALQPLLDLTEVIGKVGVPQTTLDLVRLRVSQINGRVYTCLLYTDRSRRTRASRRWRPGRPSPASPTRSVRR